MKLVENFRSVADVDRGDHPSDALLTTAVIFGEWFHVTAIRVIGGESEEQRAASPRWQDELDCLFRITGVGAGPFYTVEIPGWGNDYVVVIYPFSK